MDFFKSIFSLSAWLHFLSEMRMQTKRHSLIITTSFLFFFLALGLKYRLGMPLDFSIWAYFELVFVIILPITFIASLIILFFYFLLILRPKSPLRELVRFFSTTFLDYRRYAKAIPVLVLMTFGFSGYTECKPLINEINPFAWDQIFMVWDRAIHFGVDPWRLLLPIFGSGIATLILNFLYNFWFIIMFVFWLSAGWTNRDHGWERQFLLSFLLCWLIGGVILATYFSSMGPAFYDLIDPDNNPFQDQMSLLHSHNEIYPIWALNAQDLLREAYLNPDPGEIAGISAMPSLHNATTTLFALAAFRINRKFGWIMLAYLIAIMVGSVHLAWHYAIDAYAGIVLALVIWKLSFVLTAWQDRAGNST